MADFTISRRTAVAGSLAAALVPLSPAIALGTSDGEKFIKSVLVELRELLKEMDGSDVGANRFLALLEDRSALLQVGKFAAGRVWRDMSPAQQDAYQTAFRQYIAKTYKKRFSEYAGEDITVSGSRDLGDKGVLVQSTLTRPSGQTFEIEWLVSDRLGPIKLADIVFEGVSLSITLRELFGGMIEKRNGNIDEFIADLVTSEGA